VVVLCTREPAGATGRDLAGDDANPRRGLAHGAVRRSVGACRRPPPLGPSVVLQASW
jgi:hypothetical protein